MKSRVINKTPKMILSYGLQGEKFQSLVDIAKKNNLIVRQVFPSELDIKLLDILKISTLNYEVYPTDCEECIIICGLNNSSIDRFLTDLRQQNLIIPLKATLTPTNQYWNFRYLLEELKLEHEKLSKYKK